MGIDKITGNDITIDAVHYNCHDGNMYHFSDYDSVTATREYLISVGTSEAHSTFEVDSDGKTLLQIYENITTSVLGTTLTALCMNREDKNIPLTKFYRTPTWSTSAEILMYSKLIPSATNPSSRAGNGTRIGTEWILDHNTKYLVRLTDHAGSTITTTLNMEFYEIAG